jgi:hypothetical protein
MERSALPKVKKVLLPPTPRKMTRLTRRPAVQLDQPAAAWNLLSVVVSVFGASVPKTETTLIVERRSAEGEKGFSTATV